MPTGYTHDVQTGKVTDFREFALSCAKAFGACITMRDEPSGTPIPDEFEASTKFYDEQIKGAIEAVDRISAMSDDECEKEAFTDFQQNATDYQKRAKETEDERLRYKQMLAKVRDWKPPTEDHDGLKEFMEKQLEESIDFDCGNKDYYKYPDRETGKEWRDREIAAAKRNLERNTEHRNDELQRVQTRNKWIEDLRASLVCQGPTE